MRVCIECVAGRVCGVMLSVGGVRVVLTVGVGGV